MIPCGGYVMPEMKDEEALKPYLCTVALYFPWPVRPQIFSERSSVCR